MGIDVSKLSKDSKLRQQIEMKLNDETPEIQKDQKKQVRRSKALSLIKPVSELENKKVFQVTPMGKPRMTQRDKWKKRPVVERYRSFCDQIRLEQKKFDFPLFNVWVIFHYPMPQSWSKKKKERMNGTFHTQRPDRDNMDKALMDALMDEDSISADARITKIWCYSGFERIEVYF